MRKQCVPGPLLGGKGPGDEASVMSFPTLHTHHSDMSVALGMTPDIIFFQFELNGQ